MILKDITNIKDISSIKTIPTYYTTYDGINEGTSLALPASARFFLYDAFTVSFWVNTPSILGGFEVAIANELLPSLNGWRVYITQEKKINWQFRTNGTVATSDSFGDITPNVWHHIALTCSGVGSTTGLNIYIDGVSRKNGNSGSAPNHSAAIQTDLTIGYLDNNYISAYIDEVLITSGEKNITEIQSIYNLGRDTRDYSGIANKVAHIKMDTLNPIELVSTTVSTSINQDNTNIVRG